MSDAYQRERMSGSRMIGDPSTETSGAHAFTSVTEAFFRAAASHPKSVAAVRHGYALTYAQLASAATAISRRLRAAHPEGSTVAVPAISSPQVVAAFLGVTAARCTYLPIDPKTPAPRRSLMHQLAGSVIALDGEGRVEGAPVGGPTGVGPPSAGAPGNGWPAPLPRDIAYLLFTSGSTGVPKGVEVSHRAIAASVDALRDLLGMTAADRVLQFASLSWDTCFEEILPAMTSGATLVFDDDAHAGSLSRMLRMLERERITVLNLPTPFWHELVDHLAWAKTSLPRSLRVLVVGGDRMDGARLATWRKLDSQHVRLVNTYGCTETCLVTHAVDLSGPRAASGVADLEGVPIGRPLPHVRQVLRPHEGDGIDRRMCELYIGGPSLAHGYRGQSDETARRFVALPQEGEPGFYFRTGDLVTEVADGMLLMHGRVDRQLKVRGIRVDLTEVEFALCRLPEVAEAAVVAAPSAGRTALVAYVVSHKGVEKNGLAERIRHAMRAQVPEHLTPHKIIAVEALTRTCSGKLRYSELTNTIEGGG